MPIERAAARTPFLSAFTALLPGARREDRAAVSDAMVAPDPPAGPSDDRPELGCYSQMYATYPDTRAPKDLAELEEIFEEAREDRRRVTLRAGGNAFDAQALNEDLVISLAAFDRIHPPKDGCITVEAGATWGRILDAVAPLGLAPAVMVTTKNATAGGTLSGNCLSRFSPTLGKEGRWVRAFKLLTIEGEHLWCTPPADDENPQTREERAFVAAIGGLGFVGAVYEITYELVRVCDPPVPARGFGVKTTLRKYKDYAHLAEHLVAKAQTMCDADPVGPGRALADDPADQAIYSALIRQRLNARRQSAVVLSSTYTTETKRRGLVIHKPDGTLRFVCELILRTRMDWLLTLAVYHLFLHPRKPYFDDLRDFTFFMDGNARVKKWGLKRGRRMPTVQQTFIVPFDPTAPHAGGEDERCGTLARWLDESNELMRRRGVRPTFSDILFVNDTRHFGLSANAGKAGFAVSYAFETSDEDRLRRIRRVLAELADKLAEQYDGRVYLVKNVYASQHTLANMYDETVIEFLKIKRELDPKRLLENDFLDRTFGRLADDAYAGMYD